MRFNDEEISSLRSKSRNKPVADECSGFSLIELLQAISTVSVLVALLLPALQRKREEYAANKATQNITVMMAASSEYFRQKGSYPDSIQSLFEFCDGVPGSCSLDPQLATGVAGGYNVIMANTEGDFHIIAEPTDPGITGSVTLAIGPNVTDSAGNPIVTRTPTPGSDAARQRAFDNINASGAQTVADLLSMDSTGDAASQVRGYVGATTVNAGTLSNVFNTLDTSHNGDVSVNEISFVDPELNTVKAFLQQVYRDLKWDDLSDQDRQAIAVRISDLDTTQPLLTSYQGLRNLTVIDWGDGHSDAAVAKLNSAEAAESNGNLNRKAKFLKQYRKIVKQGAGTLLTNKNANTLIALSMTL